jgi:DNA-binding transcriptional ArsR family regulator
MSITKVSKILSNKTRISILKWLKDPEAYFPPHKDVSHFNDGVCVGYIQDKAGLSQSTISTYLNAMQNAGLIIPTRYGKWTYYKRNEKGIKAYIEALEKEL